MRILYVAPDFGLHLNMTGGAGTHMRGTIKGFRAHGHEVLPIIGGDVKARFQRSSSETPKPSDFSFRLKKRIPGRLRLLLRDLRYYYRGQKLQNMVGPQIANFKPDVIYERSAYMNTIGLRLSKKLNIPLFEESDGHMVETINTSYGVFSAKLANWIERRKMDAAKKVVVMAETAVKYIADKHSQPVKKFVVKNLGVDESAFVAVPQLTKNLQKELMLDGHFIVGFVAGQLQEYHGLSLLFEAAKNINNVRSDIKFIVIAGGSLVEVYFKRALEGNLQNILFVDFVDKDKIASYMQLFVVGVVPDCVPHMFPIKLLEYGSIGLCPLVPDYPVFTALLKFHEKESCFFRAGDKDSLTQAICSLASCPQHTKTMGEYWQRQVSDEFSWVRTVKPVLSAMEEDVCKRQ